MSQSANAGVGLSQGPGSRPALDMRDGLLQQIIHVSFWAVEQPL